MKRAVIEVTDMSVKKHMRFVILEHEPGVLFARTAAIHYDWMFEVKDSLRTFATDPIDLLTQEIQSNLPATELVKHRLDYLHLRGDIGRERGCVTEIARGNYEVNKSNQDCFDVLLNFQQPRFKNPIHCHFSKRTSDSENSSWILEIMIV